MNTFIVNFCNTLFDEGLFIGLLRVVFAILIVAALWPLLLPVAVLFMLFGNEEEELS